MGIWEAANEAHIQGNYEEAEKLYDELMTQNPDNPGLLATVGTLCLNTKKVGLATVLLHMSVEKLKSKKMVVPSDILSNLGLAYKYSGQTEKALQYMKMALRANPTPESMVVYGSMFVEQGNAAKAIKYTTLALEKNAQLPTAHWNRSVAYLEDGQFAKGWDEYDYGFEAKTRADRALGDRPKWDGTPDKTVCVYGEQGIGDEIMFASMIPDLLKTNPVILESHRRLPTLFRKAFPGVTVHPTREDPSIDWQEDFDYQISIGSLGKFYRRSIEDFPGLPYLNADPVERGDKFRVGVSWTGGFKFGRILKRTVPLHWWKSILKQDVEFVSLQYTDCKDEIRECEIDFGIDIKQYDEILAHDYYETAKVVQSCDLVISVCTSVVHLAGALGIPCWVMTPAYPAWRYQNKGPMPWYKSVRLYRQPENSKDAWIPVVNKIASDLEGLIS